MAQKNTKAIFISQKKKWEGHFELYSWILGGVTYWGIIISKDGGGSEDMQSRAAKDQKGNQTTKPTTKDQTNQTYQLPKTKR